MTQKIAVIPGDGIGIDVTREAMKVLSACQRSHDLGIEIEELDYGAERYLRTGESLPEGEMERFGRDFDAIYLGALGDPQVPDMTHAREILLAMRFELDLFINLRPVRCLSDHLCPLKGKTAADIDFTVFRENTEGLYVGVGGNFKRGTADEIAINEDINTRKGVERIIRAAFQNAKDNDKRRVTMVDKSNALRFAHDLWLRTFNEVAAEYPDLDTQHLYVDACVMQMVKAPSQFDVVVTNNMFGDIVTDLGAQLQGGLGMAASGNINPDGVSLFEPVHGSAPKYAGKDVANPIAAILTAEMMLNHLGHGDAATSIGAAVAAAIENNQVPAELGGTLGTEAVGDYIAGHITG